MSQLRHKLTRECVERGGRLRAFPGGLVDVCQGCGYTETVYSGLRGWWWWLTGGFLMNRFWEQCERDGPAAPGEVRPGCSVVFPRREP